MTSRKKAALNNNEFKFFKPKYYFITIDHLELEPLTTSFFFYQTFLSNDEQAKKRAPRF